MNDSTEVATFLHSMMCQNTNQHTFLGERNTNWCLATGVHVMIRDILEGKLYFRLFNIKVIGNIREKRSYDVKTFRIFWSKVHFLYNLSIRACSQTDYYSTNGRHVLTFFQTDINPCCAWGCVARGQYTSVTHLAYLRKCLHSAQKKWYFFVLIAVSYFCKFVILVSSVIDLMRMISSTDFIVIGQITT